MVIEFHLKYFEKQTEMRGIESYDFLKIFLIDLKKKKLSLFVEFRAFQYLENDVLSFIINTKGYTTWEKHFHIFRDV